MAMNNPSDRSESIDMIADFDYDDLALEQGVESRPRRTGTRKALLSAVAVIAVISGAGHLVSGADARTESLPQPTVISSVDIEEVDAVVPPSDALAALEDEILSGAFAAIEPTSGEPSAQILGGSDETVPMPVPVEQAPPAAVPPETAATPAPVAAPGDMPPPPETAEVTVVPPNEIVPAPDPAALASPDAAAAAASATASVPTPSAELTETVSGNSASPTLTPDPDEAKPDTYYDSRMNVPTGPLSESVGPRKVDPVMEPASKLVISKKTVDADGVEAQLAAANRALDLERYEAALDMFEQLHKQNPRDVRILMGRAVAQQKLGMDEVAILSYEELLNVAPENTNAIVNMMGLIKKQYPAVALRRLTDLRDQHPANAGIAAQLGMTYAELGENQQALQSLGTAASIEPNNAQHLYNMAVIADRAGSKEMAVQYYEQSLQTDAVYGAGRSIPREKIYDRLSRLRQ